VSIYEKIPEPSSDPPDYKVPRCPVCGEETDTFLKDNYGDIIGCDECITIVDAWEASA